MKLGPRGAIALVLGLCASAFAAEPLPVAILEIRAENGVGPEDAEPLETLVAGSVADAGRLVLGPSEVAKKLAGHPELLSCARGACLEDVSAFLGGAKLLGGSLQRDWDNVGLVVYLWVYDPTSRDSVAAHAACRSCGTDQTPRLTASAVVDVLRKDEQRHLPATLEVRSEPPQAVVDLDGQAMGATPLSMRIPAGPHAVAVQLEGYRTSSRDVAPEAGQGIELSFVLERVMTAKQPSKGWVKWAAWAGAVVALSTSAVLFAVDGEEVGRDSSQVERRETTAEAAVALGLGAALGATGVLMWK